MQGNGKTDQLIRESEALTQVLSDAVTRLSVFLEQLRDVVAEAKAQEVDDGGG